MPAKKKAVAKKAVAKKSASPVPVSSGVARRGSTFAVKVVFADGSQKSGSFGNIEDALNFIEEHPW